ncbi:tyrosine-type recombinase/integrase, partial [Desulfobacterales bacterium HSG16]|nr:tyrosine-type recombinase/integrase [Desulfobacterales bacterium HSG16]
MIENRLNQTIRNYLREMKACDYSSRTIETHAGMLKHFLDFSMKKKLSCNKAVDEESRHAFLEECTFAKAPQVVNGFFRYLESGKVVKNIGNQVVRLPEIYENYLIYHERTRQTTIDREKRLRRMLESLYLYLRNKNLRLENVTIEQIDAFLEKCNSSRAPSTMRDNRGVIRSFLRYLHLERGFFEKDLSAMIVSAPVFAYANPPKFLRKKEIRQLLHSFEFTYAEDLCTHAMVRLGYSTGLRPSEISAILLDDIAFSKAELSVPRRKGGNPTIFPLPEETVKSIAAYIVGARPKTDDRHLFVTLSVPHVPSTRYAVRKKIDYAMKKAGVPGSPYWLRHTYAQNLL